MVVTLPPQRRRRRLAVPAPDEANILLFLGVRYVRDGEPDPAPEHPQPAGPIREEIPLLLA